jgi:hypothetical protein
MDRMFSGDLASAPLGSSGRSGAEMASMAGVLGLVLVALMAGPTATAAQMEVEADPFAYALNGFSLHLASVQGSARVSIGTFGIDIPHFFHGNDGWSSSMRGAGLKLDYLGRRSDGVFAGVDGNYMRMSYSLDATPERSKRDEITLGLRGGYRLPIGGGGLYLAPWVGVGYTFGGGDVTIGDQLFEHRAINVFPTVHVGWRF